MKSIRARHENYKCRHKARNHDAAAEHIISSPQHDAVRWPVSRHRPRRRPLVSPSIRPSRPLHRGISGVRGSGANTRHIDAFVGSHRTRLISSQPKIFKLTLPVNMAVIDAAISPSIVTSCSLYHDVMIRRRRGRRRDDRCR